MMRLPPLRLLHETLAAAAGANPDKVALVDEGAPHTYRELLDTSRRLAGALRARGVRRGDRVAVFANNSFAAAAAIYAVSAADAAFVVVNPQTKAEKLAYILRDCGAVALVADARLWRQFSPALPTDRELVVVLCGEPAEGMPAVPGAVSLAAAIAGAEPPLEAGGAITIDLAALIYTSGSTGGPKGVMMTHQSMLFTLGSLLEYLRLDASHRILAFLPLAFDYGLYQLLMSVAVGATLVLERSFTYPASLVERMLEQQATVFPGVPTVFAMLIGMHQQRPLRFPSVLRVTNTAAALPVAYQPLLAEMFPNALVYRMYGLTECKRACYLEPELLATKGDSVGKAIPGTEAMVLDDQGRPTRPGEVGVLHIRGPHVMLGYWGLPEETARMLRPGPLPGERILCTQDWFKTDDEGYLYFVGRNDDVFKARGEKVSPLEIENCLHAMPGVREAAVVGVPDDVLGTAITAYVAAHDGHALTERAVRQWCQERLEPFLVPSRVTLVAELPKTATGKVSKRLLKPGP
jgi:long-chain acyl-CoA synthetase